LREEELLLLIVIEILIFDQLSRCDLSEHGQNFVAIIHEAHLELDFRVMLSDSALDLKQEIQVFLCGHEDTGLSVGLKSQQKASHAKLQGVLLLCCPFFKDLLWVGTFRPVLRISRIKLLFRHKKYTY
jgi:hypothetical protein